MLVFWFCFGFVFGNIEVISIWCIFDNMYNYNLNFRCLDKVLDICKIYKIYLVFSIYDIVIVELSLFIFFVMNFL